MRDLHKTLVALVAGLALLGAGCDEGSESGSEQAESTATATESETETETEPEAETEAESGSESDTEAEAEAETETEGAADAPGEGEVVEVGAFVEGFEASKDEWMGKTITVKGFYLNATKVGGEIQNMSIAASADEMKPNISCYFAEAPEKVDLMQDDPVTVEGEVDDRFGAALVDCSQVE